jgi:hypothetical protein
LFNIFIFSEVEDLAYRRIGTWRNLDQVKPHLHGKAKRVGGGHDAELVCIVIDDSNLRRLDLLIDARPLLVFGRRDDGPDDVQSPFVDDE